MNQETRKKVALVTGAGGIGFAIAQKLARNGFAIVVTSTTDRIHERAEELRRQGATVVACVFDLTSYESASKLAKAAAALNGRIDVLVNNAGATQVGVNGGRRCLHRFHRTSGTNTFRGISRRCSMSLARWCPS